MNVRVVCKNCFRTQVRHENQTICIWCAAALPPEAQQQPEEGLMFQFGAQVRCKMYDGNWSELLYCGRIPPINGLRSIVATNGEGCFACVEKPAGFEIVTGPVHLYPSLGSPETKR